MAAKLSRRRAVKPRKPKKARARIPKAPKLPKSKAAAGTRTTGKRFSKRTRNTAKRGVQRRTTNPVGAPTKRSFARKAAVNTKGGLHRTAKLTKTVTGTGANRVAVKRRVITRVKNGRTVKRVITFTNRGGNKTRTETKKVSGKGPRSTTPQTHRPIAVHKPSNPGVSYHKALGGGPAKVAKQASGLTRGAPAKKRKRK